jgi:N-acetylmuramic acid 6-phosphate etherase
MPNRPKQSTEARLDTDKWLDRLSIKGALAVMLDNQAEAISALKAALPQIEKAIEAGHHSLSASDTGRLIYAGAGTSARIAVQDGSELLPTFNWPSSRVAYLIAGGPEALLRPVEGAEDSPAAAKEAVAALNITKGDILIGVAASGTTPYSIAALEAGKAAGALTIGIANNPDTGLLAVAEYPVLLATGAEALAGSTRLKAGTAQKICLNLISTQLMVLQGRVKNGLMSEMQPRNEKLRRRHADIAALLATENLAEQSG